MTRLGLMALISAPARPGARLQDGVDVAGEETAVGGEREQPVWSGAQQGGAGDVFELADLPRRGVDATFTDLANMGNA